MAQLPKPPGARVRRSSTQGSWRVPVRGAKPGVECARRLGTRAARSCSLNRLRTTKEDVMHAVVVRTTLHDPEAALPFLRGEIVPRVSQTPGFVAAHWVRLAEDKGTS